MSVIHYSRMMFWILSLVIIQSTEGFLVSEPTQNASLNEIYVELKSALDNLTQQIVELQESYFNLTQENGELQADIHNLTVDYETARHDLTVAVNGNIKLQSEFKAVELKYDLVSKEFSNMTDVYDIIRHQYKWFLCQYNVFNEKYITQKYNTSTSPKPENHGNQGSHLDEMSNSNITCPPKELARLGFAVSYPNRGEYSTLGLLAFTNTFYNEEHAFNEQQGQFVCKIPGVYVFITELLRQVGQHTEISCYLKLNDKPVAYMEAYSDRPQWGDPLSTGVTILHLKQGDHVYIGDCVNVYQIAGYSNFMGFLINADIITNIQ